VSWLSFIDPEIARPLLAGWITGAAIGLADTAIVVIAVARSSSWPAQFSHFRVSIPAFGIAAVNGLLIGWTLIGLLMGALWIRIPQPRFSILVVAVGLAIIGLYAFIRGFDQRGEAAVLLATALLATLAFAVMLPALAASR